MPVVRVPITYRYSCEQCGEEINRTTADHNAGADECMPPDWGKLMLRRKTEKGNWMSDDWVFCPKCFDKLVEEGFLKDTGDGIRPLG